MKENMQPRPKRHTSSQSCTQRDLVSVWWIDVMWLREMPPTLAQLLFMAEVRASVQTLSAQMTDGMFSPQGDSRSWPQSMFTAQHRCYVTHAKNWKCDPKTGQRAVYTAASHTLYPFFGWISAWLLWQPSHAGPMMGGSCCFWWNETVLWRPAAQLQIESAIKAPLATSDDCEQQS